MIIKLRSATLQSASIMTENVGTLSSPSDDFSHWLGFIEIAANLQALDITDAERRELPYSWITASSFSVLLDYYTKHLCTGKR